MKIGAQMFTLREFTQTVECIKSTFKKLAEQDFKYVQVSAICDIKAKLLGEIAKENGIKIVVTHSNPERIIADTQKLIDEHREFDCKYIGIGSMPDKYRGSLDGARQFLTDYSEAAKLISANGMKLHYHNHAFEFMKDNNTVIYDALLNETKPDEWGFILDTYWIQVGGRCPAEQIKAMKGRIDVCHLKDLCIVNNEQRMAPVMEGNLSWNEIFEACKETGVKYAMIEQDDCYGKNPFSCMGKSFENLKKYGFQ